ncbi:TonB-dependent receptor [Pontibacter sp. HSC-36F09]|uniref:SusC/RagA family TonB-linked outer membrane protein n=1 Tax=Pontibacter sp. HSC-36F09 TaxID=2910966 RepID=UPI0020A0314F|nr:TonB-dependent receptor [Pontibacter sp. HSC-36F09]MCP2043577.1 TonB-linked SusC/RagA family outer membrane protein [Pontibacter sp. HSC-36F09]
MTNRYSNRYLRKGWGLVSFAALLSYFPSQAGASLYNVPENDMALAFMQDQATIKGKVVDDQGMPLPGASIVEKGTTNGVTSDADGNFTIKAGLNTVLVVSYLGYKSQEVEVAGQTNLTIGLEMDATGLGEVVVVGYGTQKKENLTSAISTIRAKDIVTTTSSSLAQSLQGKVPGLQIRQQDGEPGSFSSSINIRGFGEPLYVIDGIVRDGGVEFQQLNPNDIESITILKDASAAIYGLNAANGVILVTTKKGKLGKPSFNYTGTVGFQRPTDVPVMSDAAQYLEMYNDAVFYRDKNHYISADELQRWREGGAGYTSTNWFDETFKDYATQHQHNFSVRGGTEKADYFVSLGTYSEGGLFKSNDINYNRYNFRSNLGLQLTNNLRAEVMLSGRYSEREYPGGDGFMWIYKGTIISHPHERPFINDNPDYPANIHNQQNPVLMAQNRYAGYTTNENKDFTSSASLAWSVPFLEGLEARATASYDSRNMFNKNVWKNYTVYSPDLTPQVINPPRIANAIDDANRLVFQGQLAYENTFFDRHNVSATAVFEQKYYEKKYSYLKREYDFFTTDVVDFAGGLQTNAGSEVEEATMSYIGRVNYDFSAKYLASFAFRYDGSYRYAPGNRWAFFPTVSAGWRISEENFIKDNLRFINDLKIRASYGQIGENVGAPFQHVLGFSPSPNQGAEFTNGIVTGGMVAPGVINPNFTWVESTIADIGIEGSFFDNKLSFEADYYEREKTGKLKTREGGLPNTFGGEMPIENLESEVTRGFDFIVSHQHNINEFSYGVSVNMNLARTMHKVVDKPDPTSSMDRWRHGFPNRWNDIQWGYDRTGQFQNQEDINNGPIHGGNQGNSQILPGDYIYDDVNGDGIIDGKDMMPIFRNGTPKLFYGLTLTAGYKNFDMTAVFQGASLYTIRFNEVYSQMFFNGGNIPAYFYDRWHLANPYDPNSEWVPGRWPANRFAEYMQSSYRESDAWRMNASYLRMKSIEIGYTIPSQITGRSFLNQVRIYANAHNLLTFSDSFLKQFDPEKHEGQYQAGYNYPLMQSFNFGVNVSF